MSIKRLHQFTKRDVGASVVFKNFNGDSHSATVVEVTRESVRVQYFNAPLRNRAGSLTYQPVFSVLPRAEWGRLTLFPAGSKFLVIAS